MTVAADVHFDMYDREIYASPYDTYRQLRDEAPLYYNEEYDFYAVSRHEDIVRVMQDRETFISGRGGIYEVLRHPIELPPGLFIFEDPPMHTMHRSIVSRLFTPRAVAGLHDQIRVLLDEIIDGLVGRESFDFTREFALRLPVQVIGMLVGVPKEDQGTLLEVFQKNMHDTAGDPEAEALQGMMDAAKWFNEYLDWREKNPSDDVMSQLLNHEFEDETGRVRTLERVEMITYLTLITSAGSDTTATAISWAGSILSDHPDQRRELVDDPSLIHDAVEEVLRYESPAYQNARWATREVEFEGGTLPADSIVVMLPGSANHDDRKFADPERFDIHRTPGQILTFGFGPHFCLGANLARLETRLALEALLPRIPEWTVDQAAAKLTGGIDTRGWLTLPVTVP